MSPFAKKMSICCIGIFFMQMIGLKNQKKTLCPGTIPECRKGFPRLSILSAKFRDARLRNADFPERDRGRSLEAPKYFGKMVTVGKTAFLRDFLNGIVGEVKKLTCQLHSFPPGVKLRSLLSLPGEQTDKSAAVHVDELCQLLIGETDMKILVDPVHMVSAILGSMVGGS